VVALRSAVACAGEEAHKRREDEGVTIPTTDITIRTMGCACACVQEKKRIKEEKMQVEEKYMWAVIDGVKEKVSGSRTPPLPPTSQCRGED